MDQKTFIAALVAALLGLLPTILQALVSWLEKRSLVQRKEETLDFAGRQVAFLSTWMQARQQSDASQKIDEIKNEVASELDAIKVHVNSIMDIPHNRPTVNTDDRDFFQRLFLFYAPHTADGWVHRGLYFLSLGCILFIFLMGALPDPASPPMTAGDWFGYAILALPFLLLAILFHALAVRSDRRAEKLLLPAQGK